jgi:D-sedoheptulose 7-phosphate isomerase
MQQSFNLNAYKAAHESVWKQIDETELRNAISLIRHSYTNGKKIITCGNGGSACTASHYITDWSKMVRIATGNPFRGVALTDNVGLITAYANDIDYSEVFSGQLASLADEDDLLIAISGSGNSKNTLRALEYANHNGLKTLAIVGYDGGKMRLIAQHSLLFPCFDMQVCEDFHLIFGHLVMKVLCSSESTY